ncbi:hypothetical protein BH23CYA1_BH23CYA1_22330 [soil metagenome]
MLYLTRIVHADKVNFAEFGVVCGATGDRLPIHRHSTRGKITRVLGLSRKKTLFATEHHTERVQKLRVDYWQTIGEVKLKDLVSIDEAGVNLGMTRRYARAEKGKRAYGQAPATRGKNVTMIGALSVSGLLAPMTWQGGTDGITFLTYAEQVLAPIAPIASVT